MKKSQDLHWNLKEKKKKRTHRHYICYYLTFIAADSVLECYFLVEVRFHKKMYIHDINEMVVTRRIFFYLLLLFFLNNNTTWLLSKCLHVPAKGASSCPNTVWCLVNTMRDFNSHTGCV